ncbi:hypothetical protein [Streptosporangium sp. NPDC001681]|uniref:hypothetical protein n=1 Tax=Streptosporangium sp. NPDC001681 TaxID=3154395 RepID=UPI00332B8EF8
MRTVRLEGRSFSVTDDPDRVIGGFLSYALSLNRLSGRPPAEEFAERFSPDGSEMVVPDTFVAYRATESDDTVPELWEYTAEDFDRMELWVLVLFQWHPLPDNRAVIEGPELRHLLNEALALVV